jgi:uncharacterized protein YutE (UPF0331/DUF86 family)
MDRTIVEKHLAHIVECVDLLRRLGKPGEVHRDPTQFGFVVHTLQTAVQAAIDAASIIMSERRLGEPVIAFRNIVVRAERHEPVQPSVTARTLTWSGA